jgi:hypothetical protein
MTDFEEIWKGSLQWEGGELHRQTDRGKNFRYEEQNGK